MTNFRLLGLWLLWGASHFQVALGKRYRKDFNPNARSFLVVNLSESVAEVYWMHFGTEERILQMELRPGAKDSLNSHIIHEFEVRERPDEQGFCGGRKGRCRKRHFQISAEEDQVFTITPDFQIEVSNNKSRAKEKAKDVLRQCRELSDFLGKLKTTFNPSERLDQLADCISQNVHSAIYETQEEIDFQSELRLKMGSKLQNYACQDTTFWETEPLDVQVWNPINPNLMWDDLSHTTRVLLQADTTMIATIDNMVRPSDCEFVERVAQTTWDSALPEVLWEARKQPEVIDFLSRIFAYVDPAVKLMNLYLGLPSKDQSLFRVYHDSISNLGEEPRRHKTLDWPVSSDYFARLYMFCEVPQDGGAIHFPESGVHVYPRLGEALLVTYTRAPAHQGLNGKLSNEHIDCPIFEGNRTMIQHQFRLFSSITAEV
ncbi:prolyl 4-hydroxylase [Seminavis robusta]|uniref:Prolyl 4-hydroxylase n=1 Tax=Seminavis robusta TaxID=568900 RepID=A0A9N8EF35_9STRA|nr:prolyl 4-hydroxylase [Seminavis robusta]|eukprot:Sro845_g210070.1 prolyl 4-hydroxylase (430) ;mRNA; f:36923-38393